MTPLLNIIFIIALFALLGWIFFMYSKLAKERNKSIALYGILGVGSLLLGTFLGGLIESALFSVKPGIFSSIIGFGSCFAVYLLLKNVQPIK